MKRKIITITMISLSLIFLIVLVKMYQGIEVKKSNYEVARTLYTDGAQTVENASEQSQTIANMIEETTKKVVRNFKTKEDWLNLVNRCIRRRLRIREWCNSNSKWIYFK